MQRVAYLYQAVSYLLSGHHLQRAFSICESMCMQTVHIFDDPFPSVYEGVVNFALKL